ncbi:MAG: hypothetical protein K6G91_03500 [Kiritimatiellae bacterium]|nr:hypothetical protein [Kiritimatiellia bacterium]
MGQNLQPAALIDLAATCVATAANLSGPELFVVMFVLIVVIATFSRRPQHVRDLSELDDDDGGIDWRERNAGGAAVNLRNGWAVLVDDAPVHEAKAVAERLESAHIRSRIELLKEDRAFHLYGNGGMDTRMCVLVAPGDYAAAKEALKGSDDVQGGIQNA